MAIRAFLAVDLDEDARRAAAALARRLERSAEGVRWVRPENYHLTLRFLGNIDPGVVPTLAGQVARAVAEIAPFRLRLGAPRLFPTARHPRLVALELEPEAELCGLADAVQGAAVDAGFAAERRRFRPHLTLGRIRGRGLRAPLSVDPCAVEFPVHEVILFESRLLADGARYTPLERIALGGSVSPVSPTEGEDHGEE